MEAARLATLKVEVKRVCLSLFLTKIRPFQRLVLAGQIQSACVSLSCSYDM